MRRTTWIWGLALLFVLAIAAAPEAKAEDAGSEAAYRAVRTVPLESASGTRRAGRTCGRFEVLIEAAGTWIEGPAGTVGEPLAAGTPAFDWGGNEYDPELGGRLTLSFRPCPLDRIELRGSYLGSWSASSTQTGAFGFSPPAGSVSPIGTATLASEADLYSGELTWWRELGREGCTRFDAGVGLRYVRFDETASLNGLPLPTGAGGAALSSDVSSELFSAQLGAAYHWDVSRCLELSVIGKAMLGVHRRDVAVADVSVLSGGAHASTSDETDFGWGFELEGRALYRITPRIGVTAGAALLYLGQTGRAEDAFDFSQSGTGAVQAQQQGDGLWAVSLLVGLHFNF